MFSVCVSCIHVYIVLAILFSRNYDGEADFIRMRDAGVFQSVLPGGEVVNHIE